MRQQKFLLQNLATHCTLSQTLFLLGMGYNHIYAVTAFTHTICFFHLLLATTTTLPILISWTVWCNMPRCATCKTSNFLTCSQISISFSSIGLISSVAIPAFKSRISHFLTNLACRQSLESSLSFSFLSFFTTTPSMQLTTANKSSREENEMIDARGISHFR